MKVSLLKEDKIEQIVKYCMRIFEQERAECFVSSLNVIQTFQQLTIVRNLFFNNAIKAFGVLNDTTGEIEKIRGQLQFEVQALYCRDDIISTINFFRKSKKGN